MNPPLNQQAALIKRNLAPLKRAELEKSVADCYKTLRG